MTPERAKQLLPIITAFAEGKPIQYRPRPHYTDWGDCSQRGLNFEAPGDYRIKPDVLKVEPYRRYLWRISDGTNRVRIGHVYQDNALQPGHVETHHYFIQWVDKDWVKESHEQEEKNATTA